MIELGTMSQPPGSKKRKIDESNNSGNSTESKDEDVKNGWKTLSLSELKQAIPAKYKVFLAANLHDQNLVTVLARSKMAILTVHRAEAWEPEAQPGADLLGVE